MNCKPGDLAIVSVVTNEDIRPYLGRIVRCVRPTQASGWDVWRVSPELEPGKLVYDGALRPIRDSDGDDETLTWAGKPEKVTS